MTHARGSGTPRVVRFGVFELDGESQELRRGGRQVRLRPQAARLLWLLVANAQTLVTRETIRQEVWGEDSVVEFDQGVNTCIRQIRSALGDDAHAPRFVETVPRRGYRFLASVEVVGSNAAAEPAKEAATPEQRRPNRPGLVAVGAVLALLVVALVASMATRDNGTTVPAGGRIRLAVLPFTNLGADSLEYLSDGLTEEMIGHLARVYPDRLSVIARTSVFGYKGSDRSIAEIARDLGVNYVLEGTVRRDSNRVRVTAQLVEVEGESPVWSETYERRLTDVFRVQDDVAGRVADALAVELLTPVDGSGPHATPAGPEVVELYLRGRYHWNRFTGEGMKLAESLFEESLARDPDFAPAWAALADVYNLMPFYTDMTPSEAYALALTCAQRALAMNADLGAAHNAVGFATFYYGRDWERANTAFARAVELEPGNAMAHHWYSGLLSATGRHDEAVFHNRLAVELDPRSLSVRSDLAWYYLFARRYEEAVDEARRALVQEPYHGWSRSGLVLALWELGRYEEALEECRTQRKQDGKSVPDPDLEGEAPPREVLLELWRQELTVDLESGRSVTEDPYGFACRQARAGDTEAALASLETARDVMDPWIVFAAVDPRLDALRDQPRFRALLISLDLSAVGSGL